MSPARCSSRLVESETEPSPASTLMTTQRTLSPTLKMAETSGTKDWLICEMCSSPSSPSSDRRTTAPYSLTAVTVPLTTWPGASSARRACSCTRRLDAIRRPACRSTSRNLTRSSVPISASGASGREPAAPGRCQWLHGTNAASRSTSTVAPASETRRTVALYAMSPSSSCLRRLHATERCALASDTLMSSPLTPMICPS
mmetsp:Transcript_15949/g.36228  ORF Transcript_15949/g.36228 Transcript_15949/m.36228 type:complete len:200 (+) Transcript_15949:58-657(+)